MIIFIMSLLYICFYIVTVAFLRKIKTSKNVNKFQWFLFSLSLANIAFFKIPPKNWDLTFHFALMKQIRRHSLSLFDFLFRNPYGVGEYTELPTFGIIRYVICRFTNNNHWLPWTCVLIDYVIIGYIMIDWSKDHEKDNKVHLSSLLLCFSMLPFIHANSGMRNALSAALSGLAIYLYLYKRKNILIFSALLFLSLTVHPASIICVPFVFMAKFDVKKAYLIIIFSASFFVKSLAEFLENSSKPLIALIAKKYLTYSGKDQFWGGKVALYSCIIFICLFFVVCCLVQFEHFTDSERKLYGFLMYYLCFILSNFGNYDLVVRPVYLLGVLAPVLSTLLRYKPFWKGSYIQKLQPAAYTACMILCTCVVVKDTLNYIS